MPSRRRVTALSAWLMLVVLTSVVPRCDADLRLRCIAIDAGPGRDRRDTNQSEYGSEADAAVHRDRPVL